MKMAYIKGLKLLEEFRKLDSEMQAQTIATFLLVANEEGITQKTIMERLGISQAACSRNISILSKFKRLNTPGHDLVYAEPDPAERRRKLVFLTAKGKRIAESVAEIMDK